LTKKRRYWLSINTLILTLIIIQSTPAAELDAGSVK
jgi:hypothetical protein